MGQLFVSEFITSGAWPDPEFPASLIAEGQAMLIAVIRDYLAGGEFSISTTWDARLGEFPWSRLKESDRRRVQVSTATSASEEAIWFEQLCQRADDVLVIAPEFHSILLNRIHEFQHAVEKSDQCAAVTHSANWLGCTEQAIRICSDKLLLSKFLNEYEISSIPSVELDEATKHALIARRDLPARPAVIKPRDGAGSTGTYLIRSQADAESVLTNLPTGFEYILQLFIQGTPLSCAGVFEHGELRRMFPAGRQVLADDDRFTYQGIDLSREFASRWQSRCVNLLRAAGAAIPGLNGYVGFDLINPDGVDDLVLVEINPRLTTSFLGWQELSQQLDFKTPLLRCPASMTPLIPFEFEPIHFRI